MIFAAGYLSANEILAMPMCAPMSMMMLGLKLRIAGS
jgi:hypothetical protein